MTADRGKPNEDDRLTPEEQKHDEVRRLRRSRATLLHMAQAIPSDVHNDEVQLRHRKTVAEAVAKLEEIFEDADHEHEILVALQQVNVSTTYALWKLDLMTIKGAIDERLWERDADPDNRRSCSARSTDPRQRVTLSVEEPETPKRRSAPHPEEG
ncbi:hypothetical protein [Streptomyces sp. NPDC048172]|uniref:hypothetical protein n=1 Tax=Streptomyces sp. NPDC048172 TaxID=3365505 RepID=UPI0037128BF0